MRQFTPRQPPADIRITPQEFKPDADMSLKHDDSYARALQYDYEQLILTPRKTMQGHPNHTKLQYSLNFQLMK